MRPFKTYVVVLIVCFIVGVPIINMYILNLLLFYIGIAVLNKPFMHASSENVFFKLFTNICLIVFFSVSDIFVVVRRLKILVENNKIEIE